MPRPGEWIDFAELRRRVPWCSASTLERLIAAGRISCRQTIKGAPRHFNWRTVEPELAHLDRRSGLAGRLEAVAAATRDEGIARLEAKVDLLLAHLGLSAAPRELFAAEQRSPDAERMVG